MAHSRRWIRRMAGAGTACSWAPASPLSPWPGIGRCSGDDLWHRHRRLTGRERRAPRRRFRRSAPPWPAPPRRHRGGLPRTYTEDVVIQIPLTLIGESATIDARAFRRAHGCHPRTSAV